MGGPVPATPTPPPDSVAEVTRAHARLDRISFPKGRDEGQLWAALSEINSIDISRCPADYQATYMQLASVVGALVDFAVETVVAALGIHRG